MGLRATAKGLLAELIGKPEELAELRDALQALPAAPPPGRPEMAEDERRAIGADFAARYAAFNAAGPRLAAAVEDAWRRRRVIDEEMARYAGDESDRQSGWVAWRDSIMPRLWQERPALVDELIAQVEAEARNPQTQRYELPHETGIDAGDNILARGRPRAGEIVSDSLDPQSLSRVVSNSASVEARRKGLRDLAEALRDWTCKGMYATADELRQMFEKAYAALPQVEALRDVMRRDVRGYKYVQGARPLPKSAA